MPPALENADFAAEAELLARVGRGERAAFRELYARYSAPLFSFAVRLVGDAGEAEETLQDTFLKIWRHAAAYDARKSRPFTWAVTILRRTCIDHLRKRRRVPLTTSLSADSDVAPELAASENVQQIAEAHENAGRVQAALAEVPAAQRRALELALFSELTHFEIAARLEQPVGTIKSWIRRGLLQLRTTLTDSSR